LKWRPLHRERVMSNQGKAIKDSSLRSKIQNVSRLNKN
jgi:hypothetical protein